jgi:5'-3' exoribonuclease 1
MGVPGLFSHLEKHNKKDSSHSFIKSNVFTENDKVWLMLDFNGMIYAALRKELKTQEAFITHILAYLDNLISIYNTGSNDLLDNNNQTNTLIDLLYIAIDGVPPRAKMEQQRQRRFHSICRNNKSSKLDEKYGVHEKFERNKYIDTNMITPGTEFMAKLSSAIDKHLQESELYDNIPKVIFNSWQIPGEGEHKILQYLRKNPPSPENNIKTVIYGLDGDLIFLSMASQLPNMYLLREATEYGHYAFEHGENKYLYMDIDQLKNLLIYENFNGMSCLHYNSLTPYDISRFIDDYIVMCMILGNDFMPKIYWMDLRYKGYEILIETYFEVQNSIECSQNRELKYLFNRETGIMNIVMLTDIFLKLMRQENELARKFYKKRQKSRIFMPKDLSERERQQRLTDFLPLQFLHIEKPILMHEKGWRNRYYKICHDIQPTPENIHQICEAYLQTLIWNANYYMNDCISWDWFYPYDYSPTLSDIYFYLNEYKTDGHIKFNDNGPIKPQTLLMMVLPIQSSKFMAIAIQELIRNDKELMKIYFPQRYQINFPMHTKYYECSPKIPKICGKLSQKLVNGLKLTKAEEERNKLGEIKVYISE